MIHSIHMTEMGREGGALVIDEPVLQREGGTVNSVTRFGKILPLR